MRWTAAVVEQPSITIDSLLLHLMMKWVSWSSNYFLTKVSYFSDSYHNGSVVHLKGQDGKNRRLLHYRPSWLFPNKVHQKQDWKSEKSHWRAKWATRSITTFNNWVGWCELQKMSESELGSLSWGFIKVRWGELQIFQNELDKLGDKSLFILEPRGH